LNLSEESKKKVVQTKHEMQYKRQGPSTDSPTNTMEIDLHSTPTRVALKAPIELITGRSRNHVVRMHTNAYTPFIAPIASCCHLIYHITTK